MNSDWRVLRRWHRGLQGWKRARVCGVSESRDGDRDSKRRFNAVCSRPVWKMGVGSRVPQRLGPEVKPGALPPPRVGKS